MSEKTTLSARIYRFLMKLYPSDFRWHYEPEMNRFFREAEREERRRPWGLVRLWWGVLRDLVRTLPREHWDMFSMDIRYTLRSLRKHPAFSVAILLTLALTIGVNSVIFSVVYGVLIRPLPYQDPERLVLLRAELPKIDLPDVWLSEPEVADLRERSRLFSGFALFRSERATFATGQKLEPITAGVVSSNFLDLLGVPPALGRGFLQEEELPNGPAVTILSHDFWVNRFGADPAILGRTIELDGLPHRVVGITAEHFSPRFPPRAQLPSDFDLWVPYQVSYPDQDRHSHANTVLGRMRPGVSLSEARAELETIAGQLHEQWYEKSGFGLRALSLHEDLSAEARIPLLALLAAVVLVLLIACSNVANLLLARNSVRHRELAIRAAVGARATRLARQILTEGLLLALLGGFLGLGLAYLILPVLLAAAPETIPGLGAVELNGPVLGFTLACTMVAALLFSLTPAWQSLRQNRHLNRNLSSRGTASDSGGRLRRLLIIGEIALAVVLLVAGGLMLHTLRAMQESDMGFEPERVLTVGVSLPSSRYSREQVVPFFKQLEERIAALPGVQAVGANMQLPLSGSSWSGTDTFYETTNGASDLRKDHFEVDQRVVTPDYFRAMGTALRAGRFFTPSDDRSAAPVVLVDETLAERVWPGVDPVGKRMARGADPEEPFFFEVAGVVEHQRYHNLTQEGRPQVYYAQSQLRFNSLTLVVKAAGDPSDLVQPVRGLVRELDPRLPVDRIEPLKTAVDQALAPTRFTLGLLAVFAAIGLFLAAVGVFGVVNYSVNQQTREIAIRMAMGARPTRVLVDTIRQGALLAGLGIVLGILLSLGINRFLESLLFGVSSRDGGTLLTVAGICLILAIAASLLPALRAVRTDPVEVLKGD